MNKQKDPKLGYNWLYRLSMQKECVVINEELWLKRRNGTEVHLLSGYRGGTGRCEDAVVEKIKEAFGSLKDNAAEYGAVVREDFCGPWRQYRVVVEGVKINSPLIVGFMEDLASINRVSVIADKFEEVK